MYRQLNRVEDHKHTDKQQKNKKPKENKRYSVFEALCLIGKVKPVVYLGHTLY